MRNVQHRRTKPLSYSSQHTESKCTESSDLFHIHGRPDFVQVIAHLGWILCIQH